MIRRNKSRFERITLIYFCLLAHTLKLKYNKCRSKKDNRQQIFFIPSTVHIILLVNTDIDSTYVYHPRTN